MGRKLLKPKHVIKESDDDILLNSNLICCFFNISDFDYNDDLDSLARCAEKHLKTFLYDETSAYSISDNYITLYVYFTVSTILNSNYIPIDFAEIFVKHMEKTLNLDFVSGTYDVNNDIYEKIKFLYS